MNWDQLEGSWLNFRGKVKEQWGRITDADLDKIAGRRDQLVGRIQQYYGMARDEAEDAVHEWLRTHAA